MNCCVAGKRAEADAGDSALILTVWSQTLWFFY